MSKIKKENEKSKIELLKPELNRQYVKYSHIIRGDNHYQFYFDFEKLAEDKYNEIENWARKLHNEIEADAFNIVISPLQITNASFLEIVINNVFGSNLHLLHININETGKENVRTKFSYIAQELKYIESKYSNVNFYYVDDSVCTGNGVARAYKFISVICSQSGVDLKKLLKGKQNFKFKKVFLLVNRSSYETALSWVDNPNENWKGFINLCVPSYNTHSNTCPGCKVKERYELLQKRSATNELAEYFGGQAEKHIARKPEEYEQWLNAEFLNNSSYFNWLKLWLNFHKDETEHTALIHAKIKDFYRANKNNIKGKRLKDFLEFCNSDEVSNKALEILRFIVAEESYRRLKTIDKAYRELVYDREIQKNLNVFANPKDEKNDNYSSSKAKSLKQLQLCVRQKILKLLSDCFNAKNIYDAVLNFISYIKVISRDYLAKNYFVKEAMLNILIDLYDIITANNKVIRKIEDNPEEWKIIVNNIRPMFVSEENSKGICTALQYRIFKIVIHRLALMRSEYIIHEKNILKIALIYDYIQIKEKNEEDEDLKIFADLPSAEKMEIDYISSIKTATMEENDDGMCFKLTNSLNEFRSEENFYELIAEVYFGSLKIYKLSTQLFYYIKIIFKSTYPIIQEFSKKLFVENTRMLYDLMDELSSRCTNLFEDIDVDWHYEGYIGQGGLGKRYKLIEYLDKDNAKSDKDNVYDLLVGCNFGALYHNPLSSFLRFYTSIFGLKANAEIEQEERRKITDMLNSFNILQYLTEPEYKDKRYKSFNYLPYIFEDLCLSLMDMTGSKNFLSNSCYMLYKKEGEPSQLIARSGYVIDNNGKNDAFPLNQDKDELATLNIGPIGFDLIIKAFSKTNKEVEAIELFTDSGKRKIVFSCNNKKIISGVGLVNAVQTDIRTGKTADGFRNCNFEHSFLVFHLSAMPDNSESDANDNKNKHNRQFYLVFEIKKSDLVNENDYLKTAIRVLFLRNRLLEALEENYSRLLNFRFHCNYLRPISENYNSDDTNILHISDLHLKDDESWSRDSLKLSNLEGRLNELRDEKRIELLAVTGDIVHASENAATAQRKYKRAANLLFEIAKDLWGIKGKNNNIILPHDWKRRVLITVGNHDYAAMNDMRVKTEARRVQTGIPASQSGGTMAKYTYFLEFLSYFLDAPTQKLLSNDLNEIREYSNLNLIVGIFNTCSEANALQNNKVSLNREKVELIVKDSRWEEDNDYNHLVLMHHSPEYSINYFDDKYNKWHWDDICGFNDLYKSFIAAECKLIIKNNLVSSDRSDEIKDHCKKVTGVDIDSTNALQIFVEQFNDFVCDNRNTEEKELKYLTTSELFADMKMLNGIALHLTEQPNEFIEQFKTSVRNLTVTMLDDNTRFNETCTLILNDLKKQYCVLSGHEHKCEYFNKGNYEIFIIDKLYTDNKELIFEVITPGDKNKRDINYFKNNFWWYETRCVFHSKFISDTLKLS